MGFDFVIYDYENQKTICHVEGYDISDIKEIFILIVTGDETGSLTMQDGTVYDFDASDNRFADFNDGSYTVEGKENIEKWLNFEPTEKESHLTLSYVRQSKWG